MKQGWVNDAYSIQTIKINVWGDGFLFISKDGLLSERMNQNGVTFKIGFTHISFMPKSCAKHHTILLSITGNYSMFIALMNLLYKD